MPTRAKRRGAGGSERIAVEEGGKGGGGGGEGEEVSPGGNEQRVKKTKQKRWLAAVTRGDEAEVAKLLAADPTLLIEEVKSNNLTCHPSALHIAAFHGFDKIVALLLRLRRRTPL